MQMCKWREGAEQEVNWQNSAASIADSCSHRHDAPGIAGGLLPFGEGSKEGKRVLLQHSGCPGTFYVGQAGLRFVDAGITAATILWRQPPCRNRSWAPSCLTGDTYHATEERFQQNFVVDDNWHSLHSTAEVSVSEQNQLGLHRLARAT